MAMAMTNSSLSDTKHVYFCIINFQELFWEILGKHLQALYHFFVLAFGSRSGEGVSNG